MAPKPAHRRAVNSTSQAATNDAPSSLSKKRKGFLDGAEAPLPKKKRHAPLKATNATRLKTGIRASDVTSSINKVPTKVLSTFVFGTGACGELGLGPKIKEAYRPQLNPFLSSKGAGTYDVVNICCGGMHTIALTADNKIVTWGVNDKGALGRDATWEGGLRDIDSEKSDAESESDDLNPLESTPAHVPSGSFPTGTRFTEVSAGHSCSLALTDTGLVYGWGTFVNSEGKDAFLFDGQTLIEVQTTPMLIPGLRNIIQIACGANHALALDSSGSIWAWGVGEQNQLGRRLLRRGRPMDGFYPQRIEVGRGRVRFIASGTYHSFAVDSKDDVWAWGLNSYGQAGHPKDAGSDNVLLPHPVRVIGLCGQGVILIDGGEQHSAAITTDGRCLVWGRIDGGQLGVKFTEAQLDDENIVRCDEYGRPRICLQPIPLPKVGNAAHVSCSKGHTIFVNQEGKAFGAGFAFMGQLGLGRISNDEVDVATEITFDALEPTRVAWCGTGGQFSIVAACISL